MSKYFWLFSAVTIGVTTSCSTVKDHTRLAVTIRNDTSFLNVVNLKMEELIIYAKANNPDFPFAAMLIETKTGKEICRGINNSSSDPTLHGEIAAINNCVKNQGDTKPSWPELTLITTAEPCPMCQGAIIWAGVGRVAYGTSIQKLIQKGWRQIDINSIELCERSNFNKPEIFGGVLAEKTDLLFVDRVR